MALEKTRWMNALIALAALAALFVVAPGSAAGHAEYRSSNPGANAFLGSPPTSVEITLSEAVQPGEESIRVTNESGSRVDTGLPTVADSQVIRIDLRPIDPGVYRVDWTAVSAIDGHPSVGVFCFVVLNADGTLPGTCSAASQAALPGLSAAEVVARFAMFLGLAISIGALAFALFAWLPQDAASPAKWHSDGLGALIRWSRVGAILFAGGSGSLWALAGAGTGDPLSFATSPFLFSIAARTVLGLVLVALLSIALARPQSRVLMTSLGVGVAAIAAGSFGTHAAAASPIGPAVDTVHLVGVAAWVGGLLAILRMRRALSSPDASDRAPPVIRRFSRIAFYAVGLVLLAGVTLSLILVGSVDRLFGSPFGWGVVAKISLFVPLVALGALSRYRFLPEAELSRDPETTGAVVRNVRREVIFGALLLAVASILTVLSPPLAASAEHLTAENTAGGLTVRLSISPYPSTPGEYFFELYLFNASSHGPYEDGQNATLNFQRVGGPIGPTVALDGPHGNHLFATSSALSEAGTWRIEAYIARTDGANVTVTFFVHVAVG